MIWWEKNVCVCGLCVHSILHIQIFRETLHSNRMKIMIETYFGEIEHERIEEKKQQE